MKTGPRTGMKTEDLLTALVADRPAPAVSIGRGFALAVTGGAALTAAVFFATLGPRPDVAQAAETVRFLAKFVLTGLFTVASIGAVLRLSRPGGAAGRWAWGLAGVVALLVAAVAVELVVTPAQDWGRRLVGTNWYHCLTLIPALSVLPMVAVLRAAKNGATTRPRLTGAVAGLVSAGIAATLYALNCTDDSPLFVATWYPIAVGVVAGIGALLGPRLLRW